VPHCTAGIPPGVPRGWNSSLRVPLAALASSALEIELPNQNSNSAGAAINLIEGRLATASAKDELGTQCPGAGVTVVAAGLLPPKTVEAVPFIADFNAYT
jgi:hypothetical protein